MIALGMLIMLMIINMLVAFAACVKDDHDLRLALWVGTFLALPLLATVLTDLLPKG